VIYSSTHDFVIDTEQEKDAIKALKLLKLGKSGGADGISPENVHYAPKMLSIILSFLLTSCLMHCHLHNDLMTVRSLPCMLLKTNLVHSPANQSIVPMHLQVY
jgi:hypothetical protein